VAVIVAASLVEVLLLLLIWNLAARRRLMASIMWATALLLVLVTVFLGCKRYLPAYAPLAFAGTYVVTGLLWGVRRNG